MPIQITEEMIRQRATGNSYDSGFDYYASRAISDPECEITSDGITLIAHCEGNSPTPYRLRVELGLDGIQAASCTCPYDWGGDCKHVVALLLTYLHCPEEFAGRSHLDELLTGLEKGSLIELIDRLVRNNPDLYHEIELALPTLKIAAQANASLQSENKFQTQVSEQVYRQQIKRILNQGAYQDEDSEWNAPAYLANLKNIQQTAGQLLNAGDAEGALTILRVLLEETIAAYDSDLDYYGEVTTFIDDLGGPTAEAILSQKMDETTRRALMESFEHILDTMHENINQRSIELIQLALKYGWEERTKELPDDETPPEEYDDDEWEDFGSLQRVRLNVLDRQGRTQEFLQLAQSADSPRYTLKLLEIGRLDDAILACRELSYSHVTLKVAQKLHEVGRTAEAIAIAEQSLQKDRDPQLAQWLAPLEESLGRNEMALLAYRAIYDAKPALETFRHLKQLAGAGWEKLCPALVQKIDASKMPFLLADVYLEEGQWDAAIALAEEQTWTTGLLEKVADAVIPHRPDWVIRIAITRAAALIERSQSSLYPAAAAWLRRARNAYQQKGQSDAWHAYITNLRTVYARRSSLMREIAVL